MNKNKQQTGLKLLRLAVGAALLGYCFKEGAINLHALRRLALAWPITIGAVVLLSADLALMAWRLWWLSRPQGIRLTFGASVRLSFVGSFFAIFLPGRIGGDVARIFYAAKHSGGRRFETTMVLLFDRAIGLFSLLLLPLLLIAFFPDLLRERAVRILLMISASLAMMLLTGFLACLLPEALARSVAQKLVRQSRWQESLLKVIEVMRIYGGTLKTLMVALGISLADNLMVIGVTVLAVLAVNPGSFAARLSVLIPMGEIVNSLPLTPGGLGVGETAFNVLFNLAGLPGGADAMLCFRIWNILVGFLGLGFYLHGFKDGMFEGDSALAHSEGFVA